MECIKNSLVYAKSFLKWAILALCVGLVGGAIGAVFHLCIDMATELRMEHGFLLCFLPLGGLAICAMYKLSKMKLDTNRVIESIRGRKEIPFIMAPLIFVSTIITHFFGGSAGREGAALQLGGAIGYNTGKLLRLSENDMHTIVMVGMSAVFAALFGTPLTAVFFSLEVTSVGIMYYSGLVPCIISAFSAAAVAKAFGISPVSFELLSAVKLTVASSWKVIVLSILCALVSILFCLAIKKCEEYSERLVRNDYLRSFLGGTLIVVMTFLVGSHDYNGAGMHIIEAAIGGNSVPYAFALKIIFTAITIAAGFRGGEIVPTLFIGATFGCAIAPFIGLSEMHGAAIGFIALFCGVVNCPVASLFLALEVFGAESIAAMALVCGVSYLFSGYGGIYKSQKIVYSKLESKFIAAQTK